MSVSTSTPGPAQRRVYVQVPQSPYPTPRQLLSRRLKENTLSKLTDRHGGAPRAISDATPLKRKFSESHPAMSNSPILLKKQKSSISLPAEHIQQSASVACLQEPNDFLRCHQCSRKFDPASSVRCAVVSIRKSGKEVVCKANYCSACLRRHYGADLTTLNAKKGFTCPRCRNACRCRRCSKDPKDASSADKSSSMKENITFTPTKKSTTMEVYISTTPEKVFSTTKKPRPSEDTKLIQKQAKRQQLLLSPPPKLNWIPVPTNLSFEDAKARFQIREFVLRFASIMEPAIPIAQLAELEDVGCYQVKEEEIAPWVGSACVRSMILGLLGILAEKDDGIIRKPVEAAFQSIRLTGTNLSKIWSILVKMRTATASTFKPPRDSSQSEPVLTFPDPLPPPASDIWHTTRATRSRRESNDPSASITIGNPAQMVPLVESLVVAAFETPMVRQELENGIKEAKEINRQVKECIKAEKDKWDAEKKEKSKKSPEYEAYKSHVENLENALKLVLPGFAPRFAPLGTDGGGRSFWVLSPGVHERNAALNFISSASGSKQTKKTRQRGHATTNVDNHSITKEWSWFVAVWGKKIPTGSKPAEGEGKDKKNAIVVDDDSEDEEEDVEQWWGFYEPQEIKNVEKWLRIDAGIEPYGDIQPNSDKPVASLVKGLNEYANMLEWRMKTDKY